MKLKCFILDDEKAAIEVLQYHCTQTSFIELVGVNTNAAEALNEINNGKVDLLFLDIKMPDITGLDLAKAIDNRVKIVFTTGFSEFAVDSYELGAVDYLLKPIAYPRFLKTIQRVANMIISENIKESDIDIEDDYFFVKTESRGKVLKISVKDIDYVEGKKNYVAIHHNGQSTLALLTMKDMESRLPVKHFLRVQKSFIVAIEKIFSVDGNIIKLKNVNAEILLGNEYKSVFTELLKGKTMQR
jgi:DNA-binding LytR/AlgR family response regulator